MKYRIFIALLVFTGLLSGFIYFNRTVKLPEQTDSALDIKREFRIWDAEIKNYGAETAYKKFKQKNLSKYPTDIHYITHIFGEALYKNEGVAGISVCDNNFAYGCFHGFIITALEDKGPEIVKEINKACVDTGGEEETGCRHGIGHGLIEYLGRDRENLEQALAICKSIQKPNTLGCTQGVFMEYNKPGMMDSGNKFIGLRNLDDEGRIHEPCSFLPEVYQISCYYEQSQWWVGILNNDYKKVADLCSEVSAEKPREACFMGVGIVVAQRSWFSPQLTLDACLQMPGTQAQVECRSAAGWVFKINPNYKDLAGDLCSGLDEDNYKTCMERSISPDLLF